MSCAILFFDRCSKAFVAVSWTCQAITSLMATAWNGADAFLLSKDVAQP